MNALDSIDFSISTTYEGTNWSSIAGWCSYIVFGCGSLDILNLYLEAYSLLALETEDVALSI